MRIKYELFLLENGKRIYLFGVLLFCILPPIFVFQVEGGSISSLSMFFFFLIILVALAVIFSGSAFRNLHSIVENLPNSFIMQNFDAIRLKVELREGERTYTVLYHALAAPYSLWIYFRYLILLTTDIPPEHYQVWTPLRGFLHHGFRNRYDFLDYVRPSGLARIFSSIVSSSQKKIIFDADLLEMNSYLHKRARKIPSLRFVGLAGANKEPVLFAMLTQYADVCQIKEIMKLMKSIVNEIENST
jgi:hypothetical protein